MAFGFECKKCGYQEAAHDPHCRHDFPSVCLSYKSPDKRLENKLWREEHEKDERQATARFGRGMWR